MENEKPALSAKKVIGWSFLGCGGFLVLVVTVVGMGIWRVNAALDDRKAEIVPLVAKFTDCFYRDDVACVRSMSTWDEKLLSSVPAIAAQTRERLGTRGKASPIDKSWTIHTNKSVTAGTRTTIRMAVAVAYEEDPNVTESFELVDEGHGFRIRNFRVNSLKLLVDPKSAPADAQVPEAR